MVIAVVCVVIGVGLCLFHCWRKRDWEGTMIAMCTVISQWVGVCLSGILALPLPNASYPDETIKLASLRSNSEISGGFFLGCGMVGEKTYYYFYKEYNGGYQLDKVKADEDVVIFEEDRADGVLVVESEREADWVWALGNVDYTYKFHIPIGSITREFKLQ